MQWGIRENPQHLNSLTVSGSLQCGGGIIAKLLLTYQLCAKRQRSLAVVFRGAGWVLPSGGPNSSPGVPRLLAGELCFLDSVPHPNDEWKIQSTGWLVHLGTNSRLNWYWCGRTSQAKFCDPASLCSASDGCWRKCLSSPRHGLPPPGRMPLRHRSPPPGSISWCSSPSSPSPCASTVPAHSPQCSHDLAKIMCPRALEGSI